MGPARQGEARRVAGRGWAQTAPRVAGTRLARDWGSVGAGWGSVGAGWGPGGAGERASVDAMRRRGQREGGGKSPIGGSPRLQWAAWRMAACVGAMRAAKRDAYKTAAMNAGGRHKRDGRGGAHAASRPGPRRRAQSPFGRTAGRCRGKAARRWQHLRVMRDFGFLDAKEGPWRQDSRAMYPESPDCARKWMHRARMLPS